MFQQSATPEDVTSVSVPAASEPRSIETPQSANSAPKNSAAKNTGDPFLDQYFKRIDPRVATSFSP